MPTLDATAEPGTWVIPCPDVEAHPITGLPPAVRVLAHIHSAHCPCNPRSEIIWGNDDLRDRLTDVIEHVGAEAEEEQATPELLYHALNEAGIVFSVAIDPDPLAAEDREPLEANDAERERVFADLDRRREDAALDAFYRAHILRVYHSPKAQAEKLASRDGMESWRPAVAAAVKALAPVRLALKAETPEPTALDVDVLNGRIDRGDFKIVEWDLRASTEHDESLHGYGTTPSAALDDLTAQLRNAAATVRSTTPPEPDR